MRILISIPALLLSLSLALPGVGLAKDKHDHDDHHDHHDHHDSHGHSNYNYSYGSYRYGYGYPSYGYRNYGYHPYYYDSGPTIGLSFSTRPSYYSSPTYRGQVVDGYSSSLAVDVQRALRSQGYYRGAIDGEVGPGTRSAIRSYQARHGLTITGNISSSLLRSLGVS